MGSKWSVVKGAAMTGWPGLKALRKARSLTSTSITAGGGAARTELAGEGREFFLIHGAVVVGVYVVEAGSHAFLEFLGGQLAVVILIHALEAGQRIGTGRPLLRLTRRAGRRLAFPRRLGSALAGCGTVAARLGILSSIMTWAKRVSSNAATVIAASYLHRAPATTATEP